MVVHGDDFTALGTPHGLDLYEKGMSKSFGFRFKGRLGHGPDDLKEMRVLNHIVRITENGPRYEAYPRHVELLAKSLNLTKCKPMVTPGVKLPFDDNVSTDDTTDDEVPEEHMATKVNSKNMVKFHTGDEVH